MAFPSNVAQDNHTSGEAKVTTYYFCPEDVEAITVNGERQARIAWERPCAWHAKGVLRLALKDDILGWQAAREAHRAIELDIWYRTAYPAYASERDDFLTHLKAGGSVTSFSATHTALTTTTQ